MKIAIPSEGKKLESNLSQSFGRTEYFMIVNSESMEFEVIDNLGISSQGGAGIKAAQSIVDAQADCVITLHCGQNAADVLHAAGIKIYKAVNETIENLVKKFNSNEIELLTDIHPGYHNHGGE